MAKKRKNPFEGQPNFMKDQPRDPKDMTMEEFASEFQAMEKILGKKRFDEILTNALRKIEESEANQDDLFKDRPDYFIASVTGKEWSETHPANLSCASDAYYADLANEVIDFISRYTIQVSEPEPLIRELGRTLAAYLEAVVSGTKVFSAMRRVCLNRYGYRLPFYDCTHEDYMEDHINIEDIRFLIWKTFCLHGRDTDHTYSPLAPGWMVLSEKIFDLLNHRFEEAPETQRVTDWLRRALRKGEYLQVRAVATWLVFYNPLTYWPDFLEANLAGIDDLCCEKDLDPRMATQIEYGVIAQQAWQRSMSPMGCPSKTLVAALAAEFGYDNIAEEIEKMEVLPSQLYAINQDKKTRKIFFETSNHEKIEVRRDSLAKGFRPDEMCYGQCSLVKYQGSYLLNGFISGDPDLKEEWEESHPVLTFNQQRDITSEWLRILDGKQVVCVTDIKKFFKQLDFSITEEAGYPEADNYIVLISREMGMAVLPDIGYAFNLPGNRFYRKRRAAKESFPELIFHNSIPHDVAQYIEHHHLLPEANIEASQGQETGRKILQDYLSFWIGFYRNLPPYGMAPQIDS